MGIRSGPANALTAIRTSIKKDPLLSRMAVKTLKRSVNRGELKMHITIAKPGHYGAGLSLAELNQISEYVSKAAAFHKVSCKALPLPRSRSYAEFVFSQAYARAKAKK